LAAEATANALFDKKLAQEEVWIRQGIKARRTRNEGRVRALKAMREERVRRIERQGKASFQMETADSSGKRVIELDNVSFAWPGQRPLVRHLTANVLRGDRIGLIGNNGSGKSTLLKLMLGQLEPTSGTIKHGTKLEVAYFDQLRGQLDLEKTVIDNLSEGRDFIEINGAQRHVISYLGDFLFSPERTRTPVKALSGGERARLLLARLFSKPANVLVLDEPTNDLDVETLELLEEVLDGFDGTVLLVSHDRAFLDNVVTSSLVFEGDGNVREYIGGYADWLRQGGKIESLAEWGDDAAKPAASAQPEAEPAKVAPAAKVKLSYKLQRELDALPALLEKLEAELQTLQQQVSDPQFYLQDHAQTAPVIAALETKQAELDQALERWAELEDMEG
ncbi:MAG: ATP-binding cassette domain-containing protein, partial [Pseudomonas sp.]